MNCVFDDIEIAWDYWLDNYWDQGYYWEVKTTYKEDIFYDWLDDYAILHDGNYEREYR